MTEGSNNIFLAVDDALKYLAGPMHKKYSWLLIGAIHSVREDLMTDFSILTTSPIVHTFTHLEYPRLLCMLPHQFDKPLSRFDFARFS